VEEGVPGAQVKDELIAIGNRKEVLTKQIETANQPPPLLHPSMADLYRTKVEDLASALQREDTRLEASEMLRGLIESIVLMPEKRQLRIELRGNLAAMLTDARQMKRSPETGDLFMPVQLVAGARSRGSLSLLFPSPWTAVGAVETASARFPSSGGRVLGVHGCVTVHGPQSSAAVARWRT
jgi:site-specific DNA recombinase